MASEVEVEAVLVLKKSLKLRTVSSGGFGSEFGGERDSSVSRPRTLWDLALVVPQRLAVWQPLF